MPLNHYDQLTLLRDILNNQHIDCTGSVAECEQLARLIKSLLVNDNVDTVTKNLLVDIYEYCQNGVNTQNITEYIETNQNQLSQWVAQMDSAIS
ncbi:YtzH-like family protein [Bacillaceae bacterium Marseille-Q3522]|nr:YtzH-like family protein [Bacillaceae bacterium Marseille-Q3522]